jgi:hypothetical protein
MASKESYCYRILKSHSLIVDFNGEPHLKNVPSIIEGETFKKWKERVLGDEVTDVVIYAPIVPAQHTKVSTLQNLSTAQHLENIFTAFGKAKDKKKSAAVEKAVSDLVTFPRMTLEDLLEEHGDSLEPSVYAFFQRFINSTEDDIDTEAILRDLIGTYNCVVRKYRELTPQDG